jgi:hypothetical protein
LGNGKCRYATVVTPSPPNQFARFCGKGCYRIKAPEPIKFPRSIGSQCHRRANFSQLGRLFVEIRRQPPLSQCKGERQSTNAAAHNADTNLFRGHRECPFK